MGKSARHLNQAPTDAASELLTELGGERRAFIKNVLKGVIGGSLLLVIPVGADVPEKQNPDLDGVPEQIPGIRGRDYDISNRRFAFVVDITRCIGCGSCAYLCPTETISIEEAD